MKYVDGEKLDHLTGRQIREDESFSFRCHSDLACFNRCCRNLKLFLYPYDVIRLKSRLGISSDSFLEGYVDVVLREGSFFPDVLLRMAEIEERTCHFLADDGCSVYPDRPDACRHFPVEQGLLYDAGNRKTELVHFYRPPDFCLGQKEEKSWTPKSWSLDQDAEPYEKMTIRWAELKRLFQTDPWGGEGPDGRKAKMVFMAAYNVDRFREFVFESSFLKRYKVKADLLKKIERNEQSLLLFGFDWVKFFLFGISTKKIKLR